MTGDIFEFQKNAILGKVSGEPLCQEYLNEWKRCGDKNAELVKLSLRQQSIPYVASACYNGVGMSKDYMERTFKDYINNRIFYDCDGVSGYSYELFIESDKSIELSVDVSHFMWCNNVDVVIAKTKAPRIYISNGSNISLSLDGFNSPFVYLFDESTVTIDDADDESKVVVYKYGKDARVELGKYCLAKVNVFDKELKL